MARWIKIAPGEAARYWDDCLANGYIRMGWEKVGDLSQYKTREEYAQAFKSVYPGERLSQLWTLREVEPGDRIVANRGQAHILAVGRVTEGGYHWLEGVNEFNHALDVAWDTSFARDVPEQGWQSTVVRLTEEKLDELGLANAESTGKAWIFQSNPEKYDIDGALSRLPVQTWRVARYTDEIAKGDEVFLWRTGAAAGVVATGTVVSDVAVIDEPEAERPFAIDQAAFARPFARVQVRIDRRLDHILLRTRVAADPVLRNLPNLSFAQGSNYPVTAEQAFRLHELIDGPQASWHLKPGDTIRRVELHERYGGGRQGGMAPSAQTPNILLFTDLKAGSEHGYIYDRWADETQTLFQYTGEGQQGDQTMTGGNRATLEHRETRRALRLFDGVRGTVRYVGQFELGEPSHQIREAPASGGGPTRKVIVFNLKPMPTEGTEFPQGFRFDLFDKAVAEEKAIRAKGASAHPAACRLLRTWLSARSELSDQELWDGLRVRFLPYGDVIINGATYGKSDLLPMAQSAFDAAVDAGEIEIRGNQQWTSLARPAGGAAKQLPQLREAIDTLLDEALPFPERISSVMKGPARVTGWGMAHWTALYAMVSEWRHPVINRTVMDAFDQLGWSLPDWETTDRIAELEARQPALLARSGLSSISELDRVYWHVLQIVKGDSVKNDGDALSALNDELCLPAGYLPDVDWLLRDKKQIVFYGPPGTGKTYVAERFADWFTSDPKKVEVIQFHPSYAYEDFIEGIRPALNEEDLHYRLVPGLLRDFADRCLEEPSARFVLVIDEINRANLARVFGELLYLLEYREKGVTLPYSQEDFRLPENLYLIGTMNTADRSIALVDFALRRRFHFVHFAADPSILRRWLERHVPRMRAVADYLEFVNERLGQSDFAVGFSYFMRTDLDETVLRRLWERSVLPALGEYYFNDPEQVAVLGLDQVRSALAAKKAAAEVDAAELETGLPPGDGSAGQP